MNFQFIPYLIPLFISSVITLSLAIYGYKYRGVKGARAFIISMIIGSLWALANGLEMAGTDLQTKIFWANFQYFFYTFAPVTWMIMVLEFTNNEKWVNVRNILLLSIVPVITIILVWTNGYHHLMRYNVTLNTEGAFSVIAKDYGPWFWVHSIYSYFLNSAIIVFSLKAAWQRNTIYRKQALYLLLGFSILFSASFLYVVGLSPVERFDISPVLFSVSGLIIGWGIFHFRLFDLVPVARTTVIEEMAAGIIVLDNKDRIIDINPRAEKMFGIVNKDAYIGQGMAKIAGKLNNLLNIDATGDENRVIQKEFTRQVEGEEYFYELFVSPIKDYRKEPVARVLIINDITDLKEARAQINNQQKELAVMEERERMARDLHDNLGQILNFSGIQIQAVRRQFKKGNLELADKYLLRLEEIINSAHKEIREYVYNVRDNIDYREDFLTLLAGQLEEFRKNCNLKVNLGTDFAGTGKGTGNVNEIEDTGDFFGTEEKVHLLNIIKESLTNILKYAEADTVNILLSGRANDFKLIIEDDGKGMEKLTEKVGSGISIMNERARLIGGRLKIESRPGRGTRVIVILPKDGGNDYANSDSR